MEIVTDPIGIALLVLAVLAGIVVFQGLRRLLQMDPVAALCVAIAVVILGVVLTLWYDGRPRPPGLSPEARRVQAIANGRNVDVRFTFLTQELLSLVKVEGTAINRGSETYRSIFVYFGLYDADSLQVKTTATYIDKLRPGESATFSSLQQLGVVHAVVDSMKAYPDDL